MLRVVPSGNAAAAQRYHANALKREDYYSQGQEIAGQWHGRAAKLLGLSGDVTTPQFAALTEARDPTTGKQLTPRINAERIAGYDMNFHAPKSLSVLQALTGDRDLVSVFREAVDETMADIEQMAATRVRIRGAQEDRVTSNFVWADYVHFTARPVDGLPDPHLHVHCFVMNLTFDQVEGRWKAAKFHDIKAEAPHFEAAFHARLAKKISDLGYEIRRTRNRWEVVGIPDSVIRKNSRRMIEIEKLAEELGITDAKKKDELGAKTRKGKRKGISSNELRKEWKSRLTSEELAAVKECYSKKPSSRPHHKVTPEEALEFAEEKCFERDSVVKRNKLVAAALRYGVGHVVPADMDRVLSKRGMIERSFNGEVLCTTPEIMMEEARLIQRVRDGRGKLAPLIPGRIRYSRDFLSKEQREAVRHVLHSNDRVIAIRGVAGAGKTTVLQEIREQLNAAGIKTFAFAQSGTASRDVLRSAGFADADTIARLLNDRDLQLRVRGSLLIIDESGIVGIRDMARIMEIVGEGRVLSVGDTKQHAPVSRGEPVRLLEEYSGMPVAEIRQIRRQEKVAYRDAIKALSDGDTATGFAMLEHLGAVVEIAADKARYQTLAEEYFRCMDLTGKTPLVVSPTHFEGRAVTQAIREQLASRGKIGQDHAFLQYRELKWEAAEKRRVENYSEGMVLQFHQNANGIKRGSTLAIAAVDRENKTVFLQGPKGEKIPLNWKQTDRFQVYEKTEISLAVGDVIKVTRGSSDLKGKRLNNGTMLTIKKIGADGRITMENGVVLPGNHGHFTHGYCDTSHASQGRTVDDVFVAQSAASFLAASKEGFYVSCSRGKQNIRIFTDDKLELLRAIGKSSKRLSALEFGGVGREVFMTPGLDGVEWVKWIAKEKARHHEPGPHELKLLTSRRGKDPRKPSSNPQKKPEGISWEAYIKMRRENNEPDGKSRSLGSGRTKPKKREKTVNDPRRALRESRREKTVKAESKDTSKQKKQKPETKAAKKVEAVAKGLGKSLKNSLPEKAISKKHGRKISIGDVKVDAKTFSGKNATKVQENREQQKERAAATQKKTVKNAPEKAPEKKAQRPEKKIEKPKIQPPPPSPGRKR